MNPQAAELNAVLETGGAAALKLLSRKGRNIFFPRKGLVAQGQDAKGKSINASIGEAREDDGTPLRMTMLDQMIELPPDQIFPYSPSFGKPELRKRWAEMLREKNPSLGNTPFSLPVTVNALTHGLSVAGYLFVDDGDEIILPEHYWGNYNLVFGEARNARFLKYPTFSGEGPDAGFNTTGFEEALSGPGEKKIVLFNFPNNPTGYTPTVSEADALTEAVKKAADAGKTILVILDDAYFGLVFREGIVEESLFSRLAGLHENVLVCKIDGATKEDYAWGFRVGFVTFAGRGMSEEALAALTDKTAGAVRGSISNDSHLAQSLLLALYRHPEYQAEKKRAFNLLKSRFEAVEAELEAHPEYAGRFTPLPHNSGYFMCVKIAGGNAEAVRQKLLKDYDTGVIALGELIRVAYSSLPLPQIPQLFANLYAACKEV